MPEDKSPVNKLAEVVEVLLARLEALEARVAALEGPRRAKEACEMDMGAHRRMRG